MRRYRVMLEIRGQINQSASSAPRKSWRYAICRLRPGLTGKLVAGDIVEGGFASRETAEAQRQRWELEAS